jgi:hypothetical protein
MATKPENVETEDAGPIPRVHELTWALVDEQITDAQMEELEALLLGDSIARDAYVRCMQLHADLSTEFKKPTQPATKPTPVLGFLGDGASLSGLDLPQVKDSNS